jgi:hypothetical protein
VVGLGGTVEVLEELGLGVVVVLVVVTWGVTVVVDWGCDADFEVLVEAGALELDGVLDETAVDVEVAFEVDVVLGVLGDTAVDVEVEVGLDVDAVFDRVLELDEELGATTGVVEDG